jgi:UDP-N-acetylglucosamine 2-epimerase (non-hydrolysing)
LVHLLFIFGTRPEAIKLCPLIRRLSTSPENFSVKVCVTAQHREMLDQMLAIFSVTPDYDLDLMRPRQTLAALTAGILTSLDPVLAAERPDGVVVQGDTTTTLAAALAAFYRGIPVIHVEAGLRTGDTTRPFPEEMNRLVTARLTALHLAPTPRAAEALKAEGIDPETIFVTGNTGIDAVLYVRDGLRSGALAAPSWPWLDPARRLILVTSHRRENFGPGFENVMCALTSVAARPDVQIAFPVHRNPLVAEAAHGLLGKLPNIKLLDPLPYVAFVDLMLRCHLIVTDSGGIQEEAPSLGKPVLVLRERTERPEAVEAGTVKLVGTGRKQIQTEIARLLDDPAEYARRSSVHNPYGDGQAGRWIAEILSRTDVLTRPKAHSATAPASPLPSAASAARPASESEAAIRRTET